MIEKNEVNRIAALLLATWQKAEPEHSISQYPESYFATFADMARAVIADAATAPSAAPAELFQARVQPWMLACFGAQIAADEQERNHRFLEEALELVQSCGATASEAHQLVDYVYGRSVGDKHQEAGGVMVTLAALCLAQGLDMHAAGEKELSRIWTKVEQIRAKQAAKPKHSPLPEHLPSASPAEVDRLRDALDHIARTARRSREQSRRTRWIIARAQGALDGTEEWKEIDLPINGERIRRRLEHRISELEAGATPQCHVPNRWKLVPIEPTTEMRNAIFSGVNHEHMVRNYRAMLDAAPMPPAAGAGTNLDFTRSALSGNELKAAMGFDSPPCAGVARPLTGKEQA